MRPSLVRCLAEQYKAAGAQVATAATLPVGTQGFSPLVAQYQQFIAGIAAAGGLPRPVEEFVAGAFAPLEPMRPFAVDAPRAEGQQPLPRRWQYPVGYNLPSPPGSIKMVDFATLRRYADEYSVARTCIQLRKNELLGMDWDIVPTSAAHAAMLAAGGGKPNSAVMRDWRERRNIAVKFWQRPDPNYNNFASWFNALLEDLFVVDAVSLYLHPTRVPGRGPFGTDLAAVDLLDGTTIKPIIDVTGATPRPPAVAYQQFLYGVPRVDMMTLLLGSDELPDDKEAIRSYTGDQLLYAPYVTRSFTPYGFPPVEQAILPIRVGMQRQNWQLQFFTEGAIPGVFVLAPPGWTPQQCRTLQDVLNAMSGDTAMKWKHVVVPSAGIKEMRPADLVTTADYGLTEQVLMVFDVKPMEIGLLPGGKSSGLGSAGMVEGQERAELRHSLRPLCRWLADSIFTYILQNTMGQEDMEWRFLGLSAEQDPVKEAEVGKTYVTSGIYTIDQWRQHLGEEPFGLPETSTPGIQTSQGWVPLSPVRPEAPLPVERLQPSVVDEQMGHPVAKALAPQLDSGLGEATPVAPGPESSEEPDRTREALMELDQLRRYLRRGKPLSGFKAQWLSPWMVQAAAEGRFDEVRGTLRSMQQRQHVRLDAEVLVAALMALVAELRRRGITWQGTFVMRGRQAIEDAWRKAMAKGYQLEQPGGELAEADLSRGLRHASYQEAFLHGLASDVLANPAVWTDAKVRQRLLLYAGALTAAFEAGRAAAMCRIAGAANLIITWHVTPSPNNCELCLARDGHEYTLDTLPGFPGEGGFGDLCMGGPYCKCTLSYRIAGQKEAEGKTQEVG